MKYTGDNQYLRITASILASKWTLPVVHTLKDTTKRYSDIHRALPDITQKVLTDTLRKLERDGLVKRIVYPSVPPKVEYKLTNSGLELLSVTETMARWAENHHEKVTRARKAYDGLNR